MPSKSAQQKKGWKVVQSKAKMKKRTKLALLVLSLVIGFLVLSWMIKFTQSLFSPWQSASDPKNYLWDGQFNLNLIVRSQNISLFSYNPKEHSIIVINIPDNTFLDVPPAFGKWQLSSIYAFGQSQGLGGDKLLLETLMPFLAIPIDGFLDFSPNPKPAIELVTILRQSPISGVNLLSGLKTNLTFWELLRLKLGINSVRFDKVKELDLNQLDVLSKDNLPDGTPVLTADPVKLDSVLTGLADPVVVSEHKSIAVFNATDQPQLANKWARLITNLGGNVIITSNAQTKLKQTQATGGDSQTLKRLQQIFAIGCKDSPKCDKVNPASNNAAARAQINIFLGEDLTN